MYGHPMTEPYESQADHALKRRIEHYEQLLLGRYGPLIRGESLLQVAGYPNAEALRLADRRGAVGFPLFLIRGRRGRFARSSDVARWLAEIDMRIQDGSELPNRSGIDL